MRRTAALLPTLLALVAASPAAAAITVAQPSSQYDQIVITGTSGGDDVTLRASGSKLRIDGSSVTAPLSGLCSLVSLGRAECTTYGTPKLVLAGGNDTVTIDDGYTLSAPVIDAGDGDDAIEIGGAPGTTVTGGNGTDTLSFAQFDSYDGLSIDLQNGSGGWGNALSGIENVTGSPRNDWIAGDAGANVLAGGGGSDQLDGRSGADRLVGSNGNDFITSNDGVADVVQCLGGNDSVTADASDTNDGGCESWTGPGITYNFPGGGSMPTSPPRISTPPMPVSYPRAVTRSAPRTTKISRGKRSTLSVASRPAADAGRTRVGTRIRVRGAARVKLTVKHGDREIGAKEVTVGEAGEVVVAVPLDAGVRQAVKQTRHVELAATIELAEDGAEAAAEEYQATIADPPPFAFGARGVSRRGGFGEQTLNGTKRGDKLKGESGDDSLRGKSGNDDLDGGTGNDRLTGGSGNDRLDGYDGDDVLNGGGGNDLIVESRFGDDTINGGSGDDWIVGGRGTDHITGGAGDDTIFGGSGSDAIDCGAGDDTVFVNLESERNTAVSCETVLDEDDIPSIPCDDGEGTEDGETMLGSDGEDVCKGNGGNDDVEGAGGSDQLHGGAGDDRVFGRFGDDELFGDAGNDELEGGRGNDHLVGGAGSDQLNGGYGNDRIEAGPGNDTIIARGGGSDRVNCGGGRDTVVADRSDKLSGCENVRWK
jgi:Ca2+-binding RTX toxin-like protein